MLAAGELVTSKIEKISILWWLLTDEDTGNKPVNKYIIKVDFICAKFLGKK